MVVTRSMDKKLLEVIEEAGEDESVQHSVQDEDDKLSDFRRMMMGFMEDIKENNDKMIENIKSIMHKEISEQVSALERKVQGKLDETDNKVQALTKQLLHFNTDIRKEILEIQTKFCLTSTASEIASANFNHKIPTFDGQSSWEMYKKQFEAAASASHWNEQQKMTQLVLALRGQALEILQTIPKERQQEYQAISNALELRYGENHLKEIYHAQLRGRYQKLGESLQEFGSDIEKITYLAYPQAPTEFLDQIATSYFINGLRDTEIQQALRISRHKEISKAIVHALEIEADKISSKTASEVKRVQIEVPTNEMTEILKKLTENMETFMKEARNRQSEPNRNIQCYKCGKIGHFQRQCRLQNKGSRTFWPQQGNDQ